VAGVAVLTCSASWYYGNVLQTMMRQFPGSGVTHGPTGTLPPLHPHRASSTALSTAGATMMQPTALPTASVYSNPYLPSPAGNSSIVTSPIAVQDALASRLPAPQYSPYPCGVPSAATAGLQVAPAIVSEPVPSSTSDAAPRPTTASSDVFPEDEVEALLHWTDGLMDDTVGL
jgi:hypothetical protein